VAAESVAEGVITTDRTAAAGLFEAAGITVAGAQATVSELVSRLITSEARVLMAQVGE